MPATLSTLGLPRVALFLDGMRPSGSAVYTLELGEALHARGVDVTVHALDDTGTGFFREPRCPSAVIPIRSTQSGPTAPGFERVDAYAAHMDQTPARFDVYHAHDAVSGAALARLVTSGRVPGFVQTIRHLDAVSDPAHDAMQTAAVRGAARTFAVNRHMQLRLAKMFGVNATLIPNGVDATRFVPVTKQRRAQLRTELGFGDGPLYFVAGAIEPRNNLLAILDAFAIVRATHPRAILAIAAPCRSTEHAAYEAAFETRAAHFDLRIGSDVRVLGALDGEAIVSLMQAAHALVSPALVEGFGLAVLEALACETPVIASRLAPFTEFLARDEALLVDPNDPFDIAEGMLNALEPAVAAVLATNARDRTRDQTWDACALAHLRVYQAVVADRTSNTGRRFAQR